ncbi:hypothetical protein [Halomarina pelagica]|uniref:hypothetical protein n=1 Tax=Halomarina pelagica TaxID=2961599 RepID=UPI0020C21711|nr:hypothetical protein [Halomarina sp. BND7]
MRGSDATTCRRLLVCALCALLCVAALPTGVVGQPDGSSDDGTVAIDYRYEHTGDPGTVRVTAEATVPANVTELSVELPSNASDVRAADFGGDGDTLEWERDGGDGSRRIELSYRVAVNETDDGSLEDVSTREWALFNWRGTDLRVGYAHTGTDPGVTERAVVPERAGVAGETYVYLGPYSTRSRTVNGETIRLVVPRAANGSTDATATLDALATAARDLRVDAGRERLTAFVAPAPIEATGRFSRAGDGGARDMYVSASARLNTPDSAWLHEFTHSRQAYETDESMAWFDDASAEYYGALLTYRQGRISEAAFAEYVRAERERDAVLAEAGAGDASYFKGMRVLAALDATIRERSDGRRSLEDVLRRMNRHEGTVSYADFARFVAWAAGEPLDEWLDTYVRGEAAPEVDVGPLTAGATVEPADPNASANLVEAVRTAPPTGWALFLAGAALALATTVTLRRRRG